jgi:nucleotide-binding universal stress UspA family protein
MVHLELGASNKGLLRIADDLAERFRAKVIGIAAAQPMQMIYNDGYYSADLIELDRAEIEKEIKSAEDEFRTALQSRADKLEWRSTVTFSPLPNYLAHQARAADLIITGVDQNNSLFDSSRHVYMGDLAMQVGRPVLIVPASVGSLNLNRIIVGWKDTRETRRAIVDAVPLLKKAGRVVVVEIASGDGLASARVHLDDVVDWLKRHGVAAQSQAIPSSEDDATSLAAVAREQGADVIVAGAYGHSRLREWVLGGVTRDLLLRADRCALVSH